MQIVTRGDIVEILEAWQAGTIGPRDVHEWAEERYASSKFEAEDEVANEVLSNLDSLDINLTTVEDAPIFLRVLRLPHDASDAALALLREHSSSVDISERRRRYAADPFYGRFCTG
jgi:hypothetical protein